MSNGLRNKHITHRYEVDILVENFDVAVDLEDYPDRNDAMARAQQRVRNIFWRFPKSLDYRVEDCRPTWLDVDISGIAPELSLVQIGREDGAGIFLFDIRLTVVVHAFDRKEACEQAIRFIVDPSIFLTNERKILEALLLKALTPSADEVLNEKSLGL